MKLKSHQSRRFKWKSSLYFFGLSLLFSLIFYFAAKSLVQVNIGSLIDSRAIAAPLSVHLLTMEQKYLVNNLFQVFVILALGNALISLVLINRLASSLFLIQTRVKEMLSGSKISSPFIIKRGDEISQVVFDFERFLTKSIHAIDAEKRKMREFQEELLILSEKLRRTGFKGASELEAFVSRMEEWEERELPKKAA